MEQVAKRLADGRGTTKQPLTNLTLLTEANRSAGRDGVRVKPKREASPELTAPRACRACGVMLERQDSDYCEDCIPEELRASAMAFREVGRARLEALRAAGEDPAHSEATRRRRGEVLSESPREVRAWEAEHGAEADPEVFRQEILPRLHGVSLSAMAK